MSGTIISSFIISFQNPNILHHMDLDITHKR